MRHRVVIPMTPAVECSPNSREHWAKRARAVALLRRASWAAGVNAKPGKPYRGHVKIEARICWEKGRKVMDRTNAAAALKGACDGLTDAGWWGDDKDVSLDVVEQVTWGKLDAGTKAQFPGGCIVVEVVA